MNRKTERRRFRSLLERSPHMVVPFRDTELDIDLTPYDTSPAPLRPLYALRRSPAPRIPRVRAPEPTWWGTHSADMLDFLRVASLSAIASVVLLGLYFTWLTW